MTQCRRQCRWVDVTYEDLIHMVTRLYLYESWHAVEGWLEVTL